MNTFGHQFKRYAWAYGWTQADLAKALGIVALEDIKRQPMPTLTKGWHLADWTKDLDLPLLMRVCSFSWTRYVVFCIVALLVSIVLATMRLHGITHIAFQAAAHMWCVVLMYNWHLVMARSWLVMLVVVELYAFFSR